MRKSVVAILAVSLSVLLLVMITMIISATVKKPIVDAEMIQKNFIVSVDQFLPEPQERIAYVVNTLVAPFLLLLFYVLANRIITKESSKWLYWLLTIGSIIAICFVMVLGFSRVEHSYLEATSIFRKPRMALLIDSLLLFGFLLFGYIQQFIKKKYKAYLDLLFFLVGCILIVLISAETIFNETEPYISDVSFVAYFDSVVQVYLGKTLLVDVNAQYGLYALLLKPLFQLIGLSVLKFTLLMSFLKIVAFSSMLVLLWKMTRSKLIAFLGFTTILFYMRIRVPIVIPPDPYFQYAPHRLLFPTVFVLLLFFYFATPKPLLRKFLYGFMALFCAISVLWNPDTGIMVLITWLLSLVYEELLSLNKNKFRFILLRSLRHVAVVLGVLVGTVLLFYFYSFAFSGAWPDLFDAAFYTKLFYFYGYFMLPMPSIHPWNMIVLVYIVGLFLSIRYWITVTTKGNGSILADPKDRLATQLILALSVLGIGLFNYYVGRSHDWTLINVIWPALILLTVFTDRLFMSVAPLIYNKSHGLKVRLLVSLRKAYQGLLFIGLFYFLGSSLLSITLNLAEYQSLIISRLIGVREGMPRALQNEIHFIKATTQAGDEIFILSDYAPMLYLYTENARPLNVQGFGEIATRADVEVIHDFLSNPPDGIKIYWDPNFDFINPNDFDNLAETATSGNGEIILFENINGE